MDHKGTILMQRYELGRLLGQGTFAKVYLAKNLRNNQGVAVKMIDKKTVMRAGLVGQIKREISVMRLVRHPNIVQLFEVMASKSKIYFVMEYAKGGELFDKVAKGKLEEDVARKYFQQLISAVDYCHGRGVYHRDLKPENLLLNENENLKVSDFGLSALAESKRQDGLLHTTCGTPAYVAPEVISRTGYDGAKADIWSCGVILFVLLAGFLPFDNSNVMEVHRKIGKGKLKYPSWFSSDVRKLIAKILDPNPQTRISIAKIKENKWFRNGFVDKLLSEEEINEDVPIDVAQVFGSSVVSSCSTDELKQEPAEVKHLNAFDIICRAAGLSLSGLFVQSDQRKEVWFTSKKPVSAIATKLEDVAKSLKLKVKKKDHGVLKLESLKEGRNDPISIEAEILEVTPSFYFVEMKKSSGDTLEYHKLLKEDMRPALKDIVWVWQGEQTNAQQPNL